MEKYKVIVSELAERDLRDIAQYIAVQLASPLTALEIIDKFEEAFSSLEQMPGRCPPINDARLSSQGYRKLILDNYIIFFSIDEKLKAVNVERILYGRREWLRLL